MASTMEVVRSKSVRVNIGDFQHVDFFASMKMYDVAEIDAHRVSTALTINCARAVLADLIVHFAKRNKKYTAEQICRMYGLDVGPTKKAEADFG